MKEILFIVLSVCFALSAIIILILYIHQNREIKKLNNAVNDYLAEETPIPFSLGDKRLSVLQNGISDLQNRITLQKSYTEQQIKKNTEFILDVSHQLKTPLAALRLYCEIDNAENPTPHTEKQLQLISKTEALVQSLLKLEKLKSDGYTMDFKEQSICEIIKNLTHDFSLIFPSKKFLVSGNGRFNCDEFWLREAFANVIKNACEHTDKDGSININITQNERSVTVEIYDNGEGVTEEDLPNLFTRFYKAKNASPQSAGIGLAITKAITEKHHGTVTAENKNGSLAITMCFPLIDGVALI